MPARYSDRSRMKEYIVYLTQPSEAKLMLALDLDEAYTIAHVEYGEERVSKIIEDASGDVNLGAAY
jgi:hypothetical protein